LASISSLETSIQYRAHPYPITYLILSGWWSTRPKQLQFSFPPHWFEVSRTFFRSKDFFVPSRLLSLSITTSTPDKRESDSRRSAPETLENFPRFALRVPNISICLTQTTSVKTEIHYSKWLLLWHGAPALPSRPFWYATNDNGYRIMSTNSFYRAELVWSHGDAHEAALEPWARLSTRVVLSPR
jgi:hypothetical protein